MKTEEEKLNKIGIKNIKCPICKNPINWVKPIGNYDYNHIVTLLAECWSNDTEESKPEHLFLIELKDLPLVITKDLE